MNVLETHFRCNASCERLIHIFRPPSKVLCKRLALRQSDYSPLFFLAPFTSGNNEFSSASTKIHHNGGCFCRCTAQNSPEQASQARWDRPQARLHTSSSSHNILSPISFRFKALTFCRSTFLTPWHLASDENFSSSNPLMIISLMSADGFVP